MYQLELMFKHNEIEDVKKFKELWERLKKCDITQIADIRKQLRKKKDLKMNTDEIISSLINLHDEVSDSHISIEIRNYSSICFESLEITNYDDGLGTLYDSELVEKIAKVINEHLEQA